MILPQHLDQPRFVLRKKGEVFDQVEQASRFARPADHDLQRYAPRLVLPLDALPLEEPLPIRRQRAHATVRAVRRHEQRVRPKELRNVRLVAGQVVVESRPRRHAGLLELHHDHRQAIDEAHEIGPTRVKRPRDTHLAHEQEIIRRRILPIHHPHPRDFLPALFAVGHRHLHPVLEQRVNLAVRRHQAHRRAVARQLIHGHRDGLRRQRGIQRLQRHAQPRHQHRLALRLALQRASRSESFLRR